MSFSSLDSTSTLGRLADIQAQYDKITRVPYLEGYTDYTAGWVNSPILFLGTHFLFSPSFDILNPKNPVFSAKPTLYISSVGAFRTQLQELVLAHIAKEYISNSQNLERLDNEQTVLFSLIEKELSAQFPLDFLSQKEPTWTQEFLQFLKTKYIAYCSQLNVLSSSQQDASHAAHQRGKQQMLAALDFEQNITFFYSKEYRLKWLQELQTDILGATQSFFTRHPDFLAKEQYKIAQQKQNLSLEKEEPSTQDNQSPIIDESGYAVIDTANASHLGQQAQKTKPAKILADINSFNPADDYGREESKSFRKRQSKLSDNELFVAPGLADKIFDFFYHLFFPSKPMSKKEQLAHNKIELSAQQNEEIAQSAMPRLFRVLHDIYILIDIDSLAFEQWKKVRGEIEALKATFEKQAKTKLTSHDPNESNTQRFEQLRTLIYLEPEYVMNKDIELSKALEDLLQLQDKSKNMVNIENRSKLRESITTSLDLVFEQLLGLRQELLARFEAALLQEGAVIELLQTQRTQKANSFDNAAKRYLTQEK